MFEPWQISIADFCLRQDCPKFRQSSFQLSPVVFLGERFHCFLRQSVLISDHSCLERYFFMSNHNHPHSNLQPFSFLLLPTTSLNTLHILRISLQVWQGCCQVSAKPFLLRVTSLQLSQRKCSGSKYVVGRLQTHCSLSIYFLYQSA